MKPARQAVDGVLLLNKPVGITSNAALQKAKWLLNAKKAGHTGTLDPFADGLLPLCFGEATKFSAYLLDADKRYRAILQLGVTTRTGDPEGEVLATREVRATCADIRAALPAFVGEIEQIPPMHSALKHQGRPLYEYARAGVEIARAPRRVHIRALDLFKCAPPRAVVDVQCSAGTYVRTLAEDLGNALGCGAHLTALTRTASGGFLLEQAHTLAELEATNAGARQALLLPADCLVAHLPSVHLGETAAASLRQGRSVPDAADRRGLVRVYDGHGVFVGLAEAEAGKLVPRRLIATVQA
ncbi:tRNA pseudouridine synthase B [Thiobacillus denitrificans ATCC 25259]|uniref:tRNA pseudouridine synthase B n=1 Tax=Thiobacillus denitrificans (strain ATCC 25259 / T1) TaxID=292415 RepID=TRUB_THIDA|nr:tRNA pseudouridine(55) synthase TruB [Thiobacillus denitrificans]Q3SKX3.1 RecName: Full=tRNA pseudouridine synthase B; AltName: Full=tRNA pseudouridine(55) synthase; Short=Psi55 synthase; AltName: Full=tRNA pseudouridylate synthase; AltName: Full=tRNA-uridine isomerase [Thiobacillus denitrificans ATCC 25259]AAZ96648.1 tRNA pseudouridine synthase B [Thiobacillus denitrificans ATCC 25259]